MPGDPAAAYLGAGATLDTLNDMRHKFGLDKPLYVQYLDGLWGFISADLGRSFQTNRHVTDEIMAVLPSTAILAGLALLVSSVLGILAGVVAALRANRFTDYFVMTLSVVWISIPAFILSEANLGILGLGVAEPMPSWGSLLKELEGLVSLGEESWKFVPLILLVVVVTAFQLVLSKQEEVAA